MRNVPPRPAAPRRAALLIAVAALAALGTSRTPLAAQAAAPAAVRYDVSFPRLAQHEAEISVTFRDLPAGPFDVRMSRSSPGRYALHEFAKNVYHVRATDAAGRALPVERISPHAWRVREHAGEVRFRYTLFADRADGTYAGIDLTKAHLNMPATFAWAPGLERRAIEVHFALPNTAWRIATQLQPTADPNTFRAPHLQYFLDSPTHLGPLDIREWRVTSGGRTQTVRLAVNHTGSRDDVTRFTDLTQRVVAEMAEVFGELPAFDFGTYTFISCYRATCAGDGMEHRNSTSLTSSSSIAQNTMGLLGTVSHEFFHAWNVERIRPASLEPFDFTEANMSRELWFAEGFTSYYGPLVIARAGIVPPEQFARQLTGPVNTLTTHPGRRYDSPVGMSQQAPFVDAAVSIDPTNRGNTFISYYTYGQAIGLALDLTLRARTPARTLDDVMREMWRRFGPQTADLAPVRGYTVEDVQQVVADVTGDAAFAREFFARYVLGSELPDYPALLTRAGFIVRRVAPDAPWIGDLRVNERGGSVSLSEVPIVGSPLYDAGLTGGDRIVSVNDLAITSAAQLREAMAASKPGATMSIAWESRAGTRRGTLTVGADPRVEVVAAETVGGSISEAQRAFRAAWLSSRQR